MDAELHEQLRMQLAEQQGAIQEVAVLLAENKSAELLQVDQPVQLCRVYSSACSFAAAAHAIVFLTCCGAACSSIRI